MPVKNKPIAEGTVYQVGVYYSEDWDRYGSISTFNTLEKATIEREMLLKLGYEHVHIWSVTTKLIKE